MPVTPNGYRLVEVPPHIIDGREKQIFKPGAYFPYQNFLADVRDGIFMDGTVARRVKNGELSVVKGRQLVRHTPQPLAEKAQGVVE